MSYSSPIPRYQLNCQQCMFHADAIDIRTVGEQLNLHASGCNADPAVTYKAQPNPAWSAPNALDPPPTGAEDDERASVCLARWTSK